LNKPPSKQRRDLRSRIRSPAEFSSALKPPSAIARALTDRITPRIPQEVLEFSNRLDLAGELLDGLDAGERSCRT
jgi:hypothetical protein